MSIVLKIHEILLTITSETEQRRVKNVIWDILSWVLFVSRTVILEGEVISTYFVLIPFSKRITLLR